MEDKILYHGSRGGLIGDIEPKSRDRCDFGKGFYMGTNPFQAKSLVVEDESPVFCVLKLKLSEIPENRILVLKDNDWLNAILACRRKCPEFNKLKLAKMWQKRLEKYDVIVGAIADDRMNQAIAEFQKGNLTTEGLKACLQSADYGLQYVAKTPLACSKIEVIEKRNIYGLEAADIAKRAYQMRLESKDVVRQMTDKYRNKGLYLQQYVANALKLQKGGSEHGD